MEYWYYSPWQYELREAYQGARPRAILSFAARFGVPPAVTATVLAGGVFLAYTPLLQPGPPAKTPPEGTLQIYNLGGGMVV
jgi:hypothetical protein